MIFITIIGIQEIDANRTLCNSIKLSDNDLIKMPCRRNFRMLLPQFNGQFRVTFQADFPAIFRQVQQCKHLPGFRHKLIVLMSKA